MFGLSLTLNLLWPTLNKTSLTYWVSLFHYALFVITNSMTIPPSSIFLAHTLLLVLFRNSGKLQIIYCGVAWNVYSLLLTISPVDGRMTLPVWHLFPAVTTRQRLFACHLRWVSKLVILPVSSSLIQCHSHSCFYSSQRLTFDPIKQSVFTKFPLLRTPLTPSCLSVLLYSSYVLNSFMCVTICSVEGWEKWESVIMKGLHFSSFLMGRTFVECKSHGCTVPCFMMGLWLTWNKTT